ncbi:MAG: TfoX/Sxy family protein [Acidobacteria bacterium]|nr:TfoX/Sxy family protein [Acidobacteriota bacterium]
MAYDEGLAIRIEECLAERPFRTRKMFGGLCFLLNGNMCCGIVGDTLMARVGPDQYAESLKEPYAREMTFTGKAMKGMIYVDPEGIDQDEDLRNWIQRCLNFVEQLPAK